MKWKMIIADDEFNVREGLKEVVQWEDWDIEIIALAANGQEAYDLCMAQKPDVLLTDIRMPMLDGLEAAARLKEALPGLRIVIISGIQDFNYVKTALKLEADGYILKPIKLQELTETMDQVVKSMEAEKHQKQQMEQLEKHLKESMPALKEKFLGELLTGIFKDEEEILRKIEFFHLDMKRYEEWAVALFVMDDYEKAVELYSEKYRNLLSFSVRNIMDDLLVQFGPGIAVTMREDEYAIVFCGSAGLDHGRITEQCQKVIEAMAKFLKLSISAGIGNPVRQLAQLHISCQEARSAVEYRFFTGKGSVNHIHDFYSGRIELDVNALYDHQMKLMTFIKLGDIPQVRAKLEEIFSNLHHNRNIPAGYVHSLCIEMITLASKTFLELGEQLESAGVKLIVCIDEIYQKQNASELSAYIRDVMERLASYMAEKHISKSSSVIRKIKDIISARYMDNLSVALISEEVFLSPNYISLIFKKETGESITEFLTKTRMEAAKQLLKDRDLKILDISEMVGYENPTYFSTVFKKHTGLHPQKYRSLYTD